jgi:hypothetical protein
MKTKQKKLDTGDQAVFTSLPPGNFPGFRVYRNYQDQRGKSIGLIIGKDGKFWLWKSVDRQRHFHRNHRSWAIACSVVEEIHREKVEGIILHVRNDPEQEDHDIYCTLQDMDNKSLIDQFEGYEEQRFLHQNFWKPWSVM